MRNEAVADGGQEHDALALPCWLPPPKGDVHALAAEERGRLVATAFASASEAAPPRAAEILASYRVPIVPVRADKSPAAEYGARHGAKSATTNVRAVRNSWGRAAGDGEVPGVAVGTGMTMMYRLGLLVIDIDKKNGRDGIALWSSLPEVLANDWSLSNAFERTMAVETMSGGVHLYFLMEPGLKLGSGANVLGPGIDLRADVGYAVAPPSPGYTLINPGLAVAPCPDFLLGRLLHTDWSRSWTPKAPRMGAASNANATYFRVALDGEVAKINAAVVGARHDTTVKAAFNMGCVLAGTRQEHEIARSALVDAAISAGLDEREAERTVRDGLNEGFSRGAPRGATGAAKLRLALEPDHTARWRSWCAEPGRWRSFGGPTRRAVAETLIEKAEVERSPEFVLSNADLANRAGVSKGTVRSHRRELEGLMIQCRVGDGTEATKYRLLPPPRDPCTPTSQCLSLRVRGNGGTATASNTESRGTETANTPQPTSWWADEFSRLALGKRGPELLAALDASNGPTSIAALARHAGAGWDCTKRFLAKLERSGLVRRHEDGRWEVSGDLAELDRVTEATGTVGTLATKIGRTAHDRAQRQADRALWSIANRDDGSGMAEEIEEHDEPDLQQLHAGRRPHPDRPGYVVDELGAIVRLADLRAANE